MVKTSADANIIDNFFRTSPIWRLKLFLHNRPTLIPAMVLILAIAVFSLLVGERFFAANNFSLIIQQVTIIGILGVAQTLVVLTAGIDLSVGAIMVLTSVVMGKLAISYGVDGGVAIIAGIMLAGLCGAVNGVLITRLRLPPFIVTLGTWSIFYALNTWYSDSQTIRGDDIESTAPILGFLGIPYQFFGARPTLGATFMILLFGIFAYVLARTAWGRHLHAVGDDVEAARLAGINADRVIISAYIMSGIIAGLAAWALIGRIGAVSPTAGEHDNLNSLTAVVIGGTSLFGGRGAIFGTLLGALIVGVFRDGLALWGVHVLWQEFTIGILIIVAVAIDQGLRRLAS
ncbi:MAG: ABC transporter permease [Candidatus Symbiobacter sp.]|nr:ABC transporter permease [Candidatus Symbiobacter sp.]